MKRKKLGEILQDRGQISAANLQKLFKEQEGKMVRLGELILETGLVDKPQLVNAIEEVSRVPYLDCTAIECEMEALQLIPKAMALRLDILPIRMDRLQMVVALAEPQNIATIDEVRFTSGKGLSPRFGFRAEIEAAIERSLRPSRERRTTKAERHKRRQLLESRDHGGVYFDQFAPGEPGSHSGNSGGVKQEKNSRGPAGIGNHSEGHRQALQ